MDHLVQVRDEPAVVCLGQVRQGVGGGVGGQLGGQVAVAALVDQGHLDAVFVFGVELVGELGEGGLLLAGHGMPEGHFTGLDGGAVLSGSLGRGGIGGIGAAFGRGGAAAGQGTGGQSRGQGDTEDGFTFHVVSSPYRFVSWMVRVCICVIEWAAQPLTPLNATPSSTYLRRKRKMITMGSTRMQEAAMISS